MSSLSKQKANKQYIKTKAKYIDDQAAYWIDTDSYFGSRRVMPGLLRGSELGATSPADPRMT
jgi:hypothetical protein